MTTSGEAGLFGLSTDRPSQMELAMRWIPDIAKALLLLRSKPETSCNPSHEKQQYFRPVLSDFICFAQFAPEIPDAQRINSSAVSA